MNLTTPSAFDRCVLLVIVSRYLVLIATCASVIWNKFPIKRVVNNSHSIGALKQRPRLCNVWHVSSNISQYVFLLVQAVSRDCE